MPIYEYECRSCGGREEHVQPMAEAPITRCATCGTDALERVISASAFHLKGGGWYKDGYASSKSTAAAGGKKDDK
jgi:putative FmdB family regulatory protein